MKTKSSENGGTKMSKKLTIVLVIACMSLVAAAWYFQVTGTSITEVISPPGYRNVALEFAPMSLDVSNASACKMSTEYFTINKDITLNVTIKDMVQDDSGGECLDYVKDCTTIYEIDLNHSASKEIRDGESIDIQAMSFPRTINKTMCCEAYSCPQTRTSTITLTQVA